MCKDMALHLIRGHGVDPSWLGRKAHKVLDSVILPGNRLYVKTPRFGWHPASRREAALVQASQMTLAI
jgi:hypothetical protein